MTAFGQASFSAGGGNSRVGNGSMAEGFYNLLRSQNFRTTIAMTASCQTGFRAGGIDSGINNGCVAQRGVCRRSGVRRIAVPALGRLGAVLKAGSVVVIRVILEKVRQLAAFNRSGIFFTAPALAIADALSRFRAVLRAGGVVVGGVVFKGVA